MKIAIPNFGPIKYSILAGTAFTLVYATANLFTGILADNVSRKWLLSLAAIAWSVTSIGSGLSSRYWELCVMRILLGLFSACLNPVSFSLISYLFPPENRTLANSVFNFGKYLGTAFQSLTIVLLEAIGWRASYIIVGLFGVFVGLLGIFVIREPGRGVFDPKKVIDKVDERENEVQPEDNATGQLDKPLTVREQEQADADEFGLLDESEDSIDQAAVPKESIVTKTLGGFAAIFRNRCCLWLVLGASCRYWQMYTIQFYSQTFFNVFKKPTIYATSNALSVIVGGVLSNLASGIICDKYEPVNYKTKAYVASLMSLIAIPLFAVSYL